MSEPEQQTGETPGRRPAFGDPDASLIEQMGGIRGLVFSSIPILTFVPVNSFWGLDAAIWAALGVAVAMLAWSLARRENPQPAFSGFIGVAICVFIAWRTGDAKGYFLYGIITQAVYGAVFLISALVRWPLVGVIWSFLDKRGMAWRKNRQARKWYAVATWAWAALFAIRAVLQYALYLNDEVTWLGAARIGMGWPLALVAFLVTVWAVRRAMEHDEPMRPVDGETQQVARDAEAVGAEAATGDGSAGESGASPRPSMADDTSLDDGKG